MAWTGIHAIRFDIGSSINYTMNKEKTALSNAVDYAFNRDKTEKTIYESAICCGKGTAYREMMDTKRRFDKKDGIQGFHLVQSFAADEVTPDKCHALGVELARRLLPQGFQVVISTHLNTDQIHNHLVWNSVNSITGKKYYIGEKDLYLTIRRISDELCRENGLSVIDRKPGSRSTHYAEILAERNGEPTQRSVLREAIDHAIASDSVFSSHALLEYLEECGYKTDVNPRHKYVKVLPPGAQRYIRLSDKMGKGYSWEEILQRLAEKPIPRRADRTFTRLDEDAPEGYALSPRKSGGRKYWRAFLRPTSLRAAFSLRGLRALYFDYLRRMGIRPGNRRIEPEESLALKTDIAKLNQRIRQMNYLSRTGYETVGQLHARIAELQEQMKPLLSERKKLYRKPESEAEIAAINERLRPLWAEIYLCRDIERHSEDIRSKLRDVRGAVRRQRREDIFREEQQMAKQPPVLLHNSSLSFTA